MYSFIILNMNRDYFNILKENCKGKELTNDRLLRIIGTSHT